VQNTRQKILAYLEKQPQASAQELSRSLDLTASNIRYHLGWLETRGWIQITGKRKSSGAGRPTLLYSLTGRALGVNYLPLLSAILTSLNQKSTVNTDLHDIAEVLAGRINLPQGSQVIQFNQAVEQLNQLNYHASWEAHPEGPQIILRHCPYLDLLEDHPLLCQLDREFLTLLFKMPLEFAQNRNQAGEPLSPCIFYTKRD
jgi:predicted ArsR family transcriptional regulator